ncbi:Zn-ribbon domain-containing OB-fold protein [Streptomyces sulphureus]|uniref:Zn-ribbon domain-containing OB-fold protein n=1 Tax=Streptomyces sulphureus TaxID=47758 RepID=UPI00036E37C0|nr:Zn-ribbon domain-containing OB-fold protein [Streptomyces sulphureus]
MTDQPTIEPETRLYWDAAHEGRLLLARCGACSAVHHYPRPFCPSCWSENVAPFEASGRGIVHTFSTVHVNDLPPFDERLPYVAALVELAEGPRLMTNVEGCAPEEVTIGMPVRAHFREIAPGTEATVFRPVGR